MAKLPDYFDGKFASAQFTPGGSPVYLTGDSMRVKVKPRFMPNWVWVRIYSWCPAKTVIVPRIAPMIPGNALGFAVGTVIQEEEGKVLMRIGGTDEGN